MKTLNCRLSTRSRRKQEYVMRMKQVAIVVALAFLLSLPGCGGGGSPASTSSSGGSRVVRVIVRLTTFYSPRDKIRSCLLRSMAQPEPWEQRVSLLDQIKAQEFSLPPRLDTSTF